MDNGMYPYRETNPQQGQTGGAWPQPQGQPWGAPRDSQPPMADAPAQGSGVATASLVLGICACLLGMLGYFAHGIGMVVLVAGLGLASFICGVVGLSLSEGAGHGGRGMAGALLGAGGIALFLVLGGTAAGGLDRMLEPVPDERTVGSPADSGDDSSAPSGTMPGRHGASVADASLSVEGRRWEGVLADGKDTLFPAFEIAGDGSCEWCDDQLVAVPEVIPAHASVAYDDEAVSAARAAGFDAEGMVEFWEDSGLLPEPYRLVFIRISPDGDGTELLPSEGEAWFGYCSALEGETADALWVSRPGDDDQQMFFVM